MLLWLNRVGIVLNFLAGFLLAPELIGIERIKKAEKYLEILLARLDMGIHSTLDKITYKQKHMEDGLGLALIFWTIIIGMFFILYWFGSIYGALQGAAIYLSAIVFITLTLTLILAWFNRNIFTENKVKGVKKFLFIITYIFGLFRIFWIIIFVSSRELLKFTIQIPVFKILDIVNSTIRFISNHLEGNERLRSIMVTFGILIFIIGNLLQLLATF
jgi:hypothetical protein